MSLHSSLKLKKGGGEQRSVLKRFEKVKILHEKKLWGETTAVFRLPKVKTVRLKVKKGAAQAAAKGTSATGSTATAATSATSVSAKNAPAARASKPASTTASKGSPKK